MVLLKSFQRPVRTVQAVARTPPPTPPHTQLLSQLFFQCVSFPPPRSIPNMFATHHVKKETRPPSLLLLFPTRPLPSLIYCRPSHRKSCREQFYFNRDWDSIWHGGVCAGAARPLLYRPGGWEEFHHWQANAAVGALMEYQVEAPISICFFDVG